jgi:hypothetical protein
LSLEAFGKAYKGVFLQIVEKGQIREEVFVRLDYVLVLKIFWNFIQQLSLLVILELLLDCGFFPQKGFDSPLEITIDLVLFGHSLEDGDFSPIFCLRGPDCTDDISNF